MTLVVTHRDESKRYPTPNLEEASGSAPCVNLTEANLNGASSAGIKSADEVANCQLPQHAKRSPTPSAFSKARRKWASDGALRFEASSDGVQRGRQTIQCADGHPLEHALRRDVRVGLALSALAPLSALSALSALSTLSTLAALAALSALASLP